MLPFQTFLCSWTQTLLHNPVAFKMYVLFRYRENKNVGNWTTKDRKNQMLKSKEEERLSWSTSWYRYDDKRPDLDWSVPVWSDGLRMYDCKDVIFVINPMLLLLTTYLIDYMKAVSRRIRLIGQIIGGIDDDGQPNNFTGY